MRFFMKNEAMTSKPAKPFMQYGERVISAYLAAAVGDALGWPFEGHSKTAPSVERWDGNYFQWDKRSGNRFRPVIESIDSGEYSDDTQLILAVTRSRLQGGAEWWNHFARCELPFWTLYERGGGGATKRAASSWLSSVPPWRSVKVDSVEKYFSAGGNGVAMRILPHCVVGIASDTFESIARDIITDGITTHGHPRALVGALAYGYALWYTLRLESTLDFGQLIQATISGVSVWGEFKSVSDRWPEWEECARQRSDYATSWFEAVKETQGFLKNAELAIQAGALSLDADLLDSIGARNSKVSGAGTVSAVAAIYFASRYAASPSEGIRRAASAVGTDTDTIASMTGALLGALSDTSWLKRYIPSLQDSTYITRLAGAMTEANGGQRTEFSSVRKADLMKLTSALSASISLQGASLPNGMVVEKVSTFDFGSATGHQSYWEVLTAEGLRLFVRMPRSLTASSDFNRQIYDSPNERVVADEGDEILDVFVGLSLSVSSLEHSLFFYQDILGLTVSARNEKIVRFGQYLAFKEEQGVSEASKPVTIYLRVENIEMLRERLTKFNYPNVGTIVDTSKRRSFTCLDPDGFLVEIIQEKRHS